MFILSLVNLNFLAFSLNIFFGISCNVNLITAKLLGHCYVERPHSYIHVLKTTLLVTRLLDKSFFTEHFKYIHPLPSDPIASGKSAVILTQVPL